MPRIDTLLKVAAALGVKVECPLLDGMIWTNGDTTRVHGTFAFTSRDGMPANGQPDGDGQIAT